MKENRELHTPVFDYIYREVSAETGGNMQESFQAFIEKLYSSQIEKKKRIKVCYLFLLFLARLWLN